MPTRPLATVLLVLLAPSGAAQCLTWDAGVPGAAGGPNNTARDAVVWDDGGGPALYVGGHFTAVGGVQALRVAKWDGAVWTALGSGLTGTGSFASCIRLLPWSIGGRPVLVAGGFFA